MSCRLVAWTLAIAVAGLLTAAPALAAALTPPVIHESFTAQPCTGRPNDRTTVQELGCAEQAIMRSDRTINALNRTIFAELRDRPSRLDFIVGHRAWLRYRTAYCLSVSDQFRGGTEAGVLDAECAASVNGQHVTLLRALAANLRPN